MFESLLSNFLSSRLTQFVKHIDTENLKVGIWNGEVVLEDLELRSDCLEGLGAPISLQGGYVGNLRIKIPWNSLTSKPVIIELEKIHLILHPQQSIARNSEANYAALSKQASIAAAELAKRANIKATTSWRSNILSRVLNRIISSIQLRILDVHVRFEVSKEQTSSTSFAVGAVIQEISSYTGSLSEKLFQVKGLAVYWDRDEKPTSCSEESVVQLAAKFSEWGINTDESSASSSVHEDEEGDIFFVARSEGETPVHQYLLHPFDLTFTLRVLASNLPESAEFEKPKYEADVRMRAVRLSLEVGQMWDILRLADWMQVCELRKSHSELRPAVKVSEDPVAWWRFAISAVSNQCRSTKWSWMDMKLLFTNRREYSRLYLLMLSGKASSQERLQLSSLEGQLPVEQIMFSRSIAEELLGKHQPSTGSRERGWFRWGLRWVMIPQGGSKGNGGDMELEFTREEEDFLSNALEIQDKEAGEQQAFLTDPVGLIDGGVMDTMPAAEERQGLASAEVETVGPTPSRKKKPRRLPNKFQGVGWERAHRLATEWFGTPRSSNASLAVADVVVDELTVTLAVRLPDDEFEDDACNFFNMQEIIKASLSNISIRVNAGTEETSLVSKIQQLSARDMLSPRSYFPCLISSKFTEILEDNCRNSETDRVKSGDVQSLPAVVCNVKVIGGTTEIHVLLQPLEIVLLPECLHALGAFFIPEYQAPFHENNIVEALNNIDDGPGRIQAKLSYLVQKMSHQVILDLRAEKPRLVIPGDVFRPDLTLIVGLDELNVGSSPYSWHGATAWAVAAAAKTLAGCANHKERQKQMQRMFFGSLSLKMKGVRLFLAESAPVANFSFMTYRLAHALRARMDSDGHSLSNPQFSKASADVLLPMDVDLSILLSLLRSDASMPLIFLGTHISRLAVEGSLHEITQALEVFEKMGQISLPSLERRQKIKEQARRANLGRPYCSSAAHKSGMLRRREALQQTPFIDTAIQITSPNPDRCAEKDAVHESATTNETQMLKEGVACKINNAEEDSHRSSADAVPGTESQDVTVASLTSEADMTLSQTSGRAEVDSTPKQQSAAQWRVLQWLNGGRKLSPSTCPPESNPVSRPEMPRPADAEQDGTTIPSAKQGPGQIGAVSSIQNIEKRNERSWLWRVAGGQSSGSVAVASEPGKIYTSDVSGVAEGMRGAQLEEVRGAHFVGASDQKLREAADMDRSWFRWRSATRKDDPPPQVLPAGTAELSNANQVQNRTSGSLLKHLKFLYPASQAAEAPDSARDEESIARSKVMEFQLYTRSEAYRAVESGGLQWERLTWKEKLRACLQVDADSGGKARTAEFSDNADWRLRGQAVELPDDSGHHPDLPKLRERYSSSFIATDLDEMSRSDAIHVEAQVSVDSCSFAVLEHRSGQESFSHVSTPCAAFALQLLQCDTDPEPAGRRDASFSLLAVLQRHGLRLSSTVGDVLAFCGSKESVVAHAEDVCVLSSRDGETQIAVKSSGLVDSGPELRPMLHLSLSVFETGYTRLDGARVAVSATLRCLSTRIDVAMCQNLSRLHSQFLLRNKASQEAGSSKAPPINKMDLNDVISAKLMVDFGAVNVTVQDPLKKNNWNRVIGIGFRCAIDSGPDAEKLGELSLGYLGIDNSTDESKTWVRVLGPQDSWPLRPQPDTASNSAPPHPAQSHRPSEPLFSASLQRKADGADAASYRASCLALELQRAIRRAPNLIQDQKLNLRSQWQELKIDFRTQKRCAAGKDVISFLVDEWGAVDREEGLRLGQVLIDQGLMHKVPEPGSFEDSNSLFRFYADEEDVTAPSKVAEDGCRVVQAKSFVRKRFLLQVKLIALRMQASAPCFESISNTASALRALEPQQEQRQGQERGLAMKVGDDVKTKALAVLDNLDLDLCSAGFCCYFPAIVNGYELVASFSGLNVHSAFVSTDFSDMRNRECLREEVGEVRLGTAGEAGVRGVRTTGFESLAWTAGQSHSFCIRLSGCQAVDTKRQQADVVKCFDVEVGLCTRPCGIVTVDLAITPLHLELSDQFLNTIATAAAFIPVRLESSSEAQGGDVDSTAGHVLLVAKTFFSGGYGFKFDFGGLTVALPACPAEPHSFVFCVKPASAVCQILFRDCGLLPLDARDRPPVSARGARGPAVATGVAGLLVDTLGAYDLALIMDDVVLTVQERAVLCGRSTWSEAAGSAALVAEPGPGQGMQSLASGDEWRLLHLTASWRPGDAGCGLSLDCRLAGGSALLDVDAVSACVQRLHWLWGLVAKPPAAPDRAPASRSRTSRTKANFPSIESGVKSRSKVSGAAGQRDANDDQSTPNWGSWAQALQGRLDVRLSSGEWSLLAGPQQLCGTAAHHLCLTTHVICHGVAEASGEGACQGRSVKINVQTGVSLAWCILSDERAGTPRTSCVRDGPVLSLSHKLLDLPRATLRLSLVGPSGGMGWADLLSRGGDAKAAVECLVDPVAEARVSLADVEAAEALVLHTMAALAPSAAPPASPGLASSCASGRGLADSDAADAESCARVAPRVAKLSAPAAKAKACGDGAAGRLATGPGAEGGEGSAEAARRVAETLSSLSLRVAGVKLVVVECRRGGQAGGLQRLPLLHFGVSGVWARLDAEDRRGVCFSGGVVAACDYLNRGIGQWEPLLERWACHWTVRTDTTLGSVVAGARGRVEAEVGSGEPLNVNVSCAVLDVVMGVLARDAKRWLAARAAARAPPAAVPVEAAGGENRDGRDGDAFHPLWIRNETGQPLILESLDGPAPYAAAGQRQEVRAGSVQPVTCAPLVTAATAGAGPGLPQVSLRQLRVYLAQRARAEPGSADGGAADVWATGLGGSGRWSAGEEEVGEGVTGEAGALLQGQIDLDVTGRQVSKRCLTGVRGEGAR